MKRKLLAICGVIAFIAGFGMTADIAVAHANAPTHFVKNVTWYYWPESSINGGPSGYVMDDPNYGGNGTQQQVWTPNGNPQQGWALFSDPQFGSGYYQLRNQNNKCLDDQYDKPDNGTKVQLWDCLNNANQAWFYDKYQGVNGAYAVIINYNGACLVDAHPYTDGGKTTMWQCAYPIDNAETWQIPASSWAPTRLPQLQLHL